MPLVDMQGHLGVGEETLACRPPALETAVAYMNTYDIESMCLASSEAVSDIVGGNAALATAIKTDARFKGWLELSVHQVEVSQTLARQYLTKPQWVGARFEQRNSGDALDGAGGHIVLNALRRYSKPILVTCHAPDTMASFLRSAREFHTLRFVLSPQTASLTSDAPAAIRDLINVSFLPSAAWCERDVMASAIAVLGERRVLWGSDWGKLHPSAAIGMVRDSALNKLQRERIVMRNPRELLIQE